MDEDMLADVDTLRSCDVCFRSEVADIVDGDPNAGLIPMRLADDGCRLCPACDDEPAKVALWRRRRKSGRRLTRR